MFPVTHVKLPTKQKLCYYVLKYSKYSNSTENEGVKISNKTSWKKSCQEMAQQAQAYAVDSDNLSSPTW